ncbi:MAG: fumarate reductase/succinate dehydrogenase flavoprotein subunit, partial [Myxococcota bacterium]
AGPLEERWTEHPAKSKLVAPHNRRKHTVIVVGTGLAGGAAAATLGELGYHVKCFCFQDSPRRAHSIAAQGGINAAKNYQNDGDSVYRLFYDTVKGGDFRSRESNVYRLAELSVNIIDQAVSQGVPFAREYGGLLANRSFGGAQVSRTFYARGQTGQQLLLGAYSALERQIEEGNVEMFPRTEMLELIMYKGKARGIVIRDLVSGEVKVHTADVVALCTGGYGNVFYLSTNAKGSNCTAAWRAHRHGAHFANPCFTQIHPTCIPRSGEYQSKLTLMSESLRNDGRVWVPRNKEDVTKDPTKIKEEDRYYYLEERYPAFGNLVPRDVASRNAMYVCDDGLGVGLEVNGERRAVYLDFESAIMRLGKQAAPHGASTKEIRTAGEAKVAERYGNLFEMYERITGDNPYKTPMMIYPATHYTMGGLWVDYNLMTSIDGLFAGGEANFSDHGANRLGASALMQGLADGYFVLPFTIGDYLGKQVAQATVSADRGDVSAMEYAFPPLAEDDKVCMDAVAEVQARVDKLMNAPEPKHGPDHFHRRLGNIIWKYCGMSRSEVGLKQALEEIPKLREEFYRHVKVTGSPKTMNQTLEKAGRVADFLELGELMCRDALDRAESCGGHFREEHQTEDGEAKRDDESFQHVAAWAFSGDPSAPVLHKEALSFEYVKPTMRSYK